MKVYWFVFWDSTCQTVAAGSLEEAEEEMERREAPLHKLLAVVPEDERRA